MFGPAATVELTQLWDVLSPPSRLGPYLLGGRLAQSEGALLFTATGGPFADAEGVLKLTSSHHAARLSAELERLVRCADAGVPGVVRPLAREAGWLPVPGLLDAHVATLPLPFLTGGDLLNIRRVRVSDHMPTALATMESRRGRVHAARLTLEVAHVLGTTLRHMLELPSPFVHGHLSPHCVLLPHPDAALSELTLINLAHALDLTNVSPAEAAAACQADVAAFGTLLSELLNGEYASRQLQSLIADSRAGRYANLADPRLWQALQRAERAQRDAPTSRWRPRFWGLSW